MRRVLSLFACVAICSAMMVSCKNAKTVEPTAEEIQAQKQALADSVLADIDALAEQFSESQSKSFGFKFLELTDNEKLVKPDYLLDPSVASTLVSKTQKVNALAIYFVDNNLRTLYEMPCDEVKEAMAKLAAEVNFPVDVEYLTGDAPASEKMEKQYEICKERGDLAYFWQFEYALLSEISYVMANNPELFYSKITDEQWQTFNNRFKTIVRAVEKLAKYDEEMAQLWEFRCKYYPYTSDEENISNNQNAETAKQYHIVNKDKYVARRNALLQ